ncbi:Glycosyl hydrolases family 2 [Reichenbachiella agariperforans]|uniref:Glycosyl hydrolases family 2 n=2 Tax=Reichenbachiella agariperforans TaxID=156994 RepID=A0A1M6UGS6_REIAG|nr:Glycosyl hydrolases family 2 [Reichenbachiella agariperforans]
MWIDMKLRIRDFFALLIVFSSLVGCQDTTIQREQRLFNEDWQFHLGEVDDPSASDVSWAEVVLPHDWSIRQSYQPENTAASTGFVPGGIGWYRKSFKVPEDGRQTTVVFDGVYCNAEVWINGEYLGKRPNGYSSFAHELTPYLRYDVPNTLQVKVDHSAYADTRWYTGSGIYRDVSLVRTHPVHVAQWGLQITTPQVSESEAEVRVNAQIVGASPETEVVLDILGPDGALIGTTNMTESSGVGYSAVLKVVNPQRWGLETPALYQAVAHVKHQGQEVDQQTQNFGIRSIRFDADQGFFLNEESVKIKGVNIHHDAGAFGAAVPKSIWEYRVAQLKSIGVNAIRMSHNPHSPLLMEVCDELGMLVMDEFFDEWHQPKGKSLVYLGDNQAKGDIAQGYSDVFMEWAERDLKDLIRRDFNHPSVIMWSIGNEIEWTFPDYSKAFSVINPNHAGYGQTPEFDPEKVKATFDEVTGGVDSLALIAGMLSEWVKEMDTTRYVTCGSVRPSIAAASGYADAVDVLGFNYRAECYDAAHETYPEMKIIGSENWGAYSEWENVASRPFVAGMFAWTGFAYMGEAGPWPRKGLEISFFDYAGFKTPRGHFFECLWVEKPKVYAVTTRAEESEFSYDPELGWRFDMQMTAPPVWSQLRRWEWYQNIHPYWNYEEGELIVVQAYSNCEEVELLINEKSLGRKLRSDFAEDNIVKWKLPYESGQLTVKGYNEGQLVTEDQLISAGKASTVMATVAYGAAEGDDIIPVALQLHDAEGNPVRHEESQIKIALAGAELVAVDNGWEKNVANHYLPMITTHEGRAMLFVRALGEQEITLNLETGSFTEKLTLTD